MQDLSVGRIDLEDSVRRKDRNAEHGLQQVYDWVAEHPWPAGQPF
jgi:hypothetical protein